MGRAVLGVPVGWTVMVVVEDVVGRVAVVEDGGDAAEELGGAGEEEVLPGGVLGRVVVVGSCAVVVVSWGCVCVCVVCVGAGRTTVGTPVEPPSGGTEEDGGSEESRVPGASTSEEGIPGPVCVTPFVAVRGSLVVGALATGEESAGVRVDAVVLELVNSGFPAVILGIVTDGVTNVGRGVLVSDAGAVVSPVGVPVVEDCLVG